PVRQCKSCFVISEIAPQIAARQVRDKVADLGEWRSPAADATRGGVLAAKKGMCCRCAGVFIVARNGNQVYQLLRWLTAIARHRSVRVSRLPDYPFASSGLLHDCAKIAQIVSDR